MLEDIKHISASDSARHPRMQLLSFFGVFCTPQSITVDFQSAWPSKALHLFVFIGALYGNVQRVVPKVPKKAPSTSYFSS